MRKIKNQSLIYLAITVMLVAIAVYLTIRYGSVQLIFTCAGFFVGSAVLVVMILIWYAIYPLLIDYNNEDQ
jgi:hypothetical protein